MLKFAVPPAIALVILTSSLCGADDPAPTGEDIPVVIPTTSGAEVTPEPVAVTEPPATLAAMPDWVFDAYAPLLEVPEPSGLCYHPGRNTLFIVDDGDIERPAAVFELDLDAKVLQREKLGTDLEGICYCPLDGLLYVAEEYGEKIYVVDPEDLDQLGTVTYTREFAGSELLVAGGNGAEGIEFILDDEEPEAGYFLLLNQDDPHGLFRINHEDIDLDSNKEVPIRSWTPIEPINAGSLHYVHADRQLWVIHSWMNVMEYVDVTTMEITGWEVFPGAAQEAVAVDGDGRLWIGYDLGGIARYTRPGDQPDAAGS